MAGNGLLGYYLYDARQKLAYYQTIRDAEAHRDKCFREAEELKKEASEVESQLAVAKSELQRWARALDITRPAIEAKQRAEELQRQVQLLESQLGSLRDRQDLAEAGFFEREYDYDFPEVIKAQLEEIVGKQKEMIKSGTACICNTEWTVAGDARAGQRMINEQVKLMLRAFNGECDAAINKVTFKNLVATEKRIKRSFESLNKLGKTKQIEISPYFLSLKLEELNLQYAYARAKEEYRQKQLEIQRQIREEEKARREIEKAIKEAEKKERLKAKALEEAKKELISAHGRESEELRALISKLEGELSEALAAKQAAMSRAQLTKSGHVYVLSNIGTMGEGVYKIGMTRRERPDDRVRELGDASVPFPFDVHAMIFSANAPELESKLHQRFHDRRVNLVNLRREYFHVTLDEIKQAVMELHGDAVFNELPDAVEYYETIAIRKRKGILIEQHAGQPIDAQVIDDSSVLE